MMSFISYINNSVIKCLIYFTSHMSNRIEIIHENHSLFVGHFNMGNIAQDKNLMKIILPIKN